MAEIIICTTVDTWQSDGPSPGYLAGEPYSYRGSTSGRVSNVYAYLAPVDTSIGYGYESLSLDLSVEVGDIIYAVVADYNSGDSFGRTGGHSQILDAFLDHHKAEALAEEALKDNNTNFSFTYDGKDYHRSWDGYFESLNSLDVWEIRVSRYANDPFRTSQNSNIGFKRGH